MFGRKNYEDEEHSFWISYADMLIGLLISFMVIAILLYQVKPSAPCPPSQKLPLPNGQLSQMTKQFRTAFGSDSTIEVTNEGTVRFRILNGTQQLFHLNNNQPTPYLEKKLNDFIPKYFDIIKSVIDTLNIKEIRIEGHTDTVGMKNMRRSEILYNFKLSGERAAAVQRIIFYHPYFGMQDYDFKKYLFDHIINCGYGTSQPLDKKGDLVSKTGNPIDMNQSRRIEFRIITDKSGN